MNLQSQGDIYVGITYSEARQIARDVFEANFYKLSKTALEVARQRADELISTYLEKLAKRNPEALGSTQDPDMQYALFTAQKEYARTGDSDLADILVDILVDRASQSGRSLLQIVLNESLLVAPKLTPCQFDTLSTIFIIRYTRRPGMASLDMLGQYLRTTVLPFADDLRTQNSCYQHLEYAGCGAVQTGQVRLERAIRSNYPGLFWKGADKQAIDELLETVEVPPEFIVPCLHNPELFQFNALDETAISEMCQGRGYSEDATMRIVGFQKKHAMSDPEVIGVLVSVEHGMERLIDIWHNSPMKNFTLTSVGIAIAHANIRRKIKEEFDITIWIR